MFFRMLAYRRDARSNQPARKVRQTQLSGFLAAKFHILKPRWLLTAVQQTKAWTDFINSRFDEAAEIADRIGWRIINGMGAVLGEQQKQRQAELAEETERLRKALRSEFETKFTSSERRAEAAEERVKELETKLAEVETADARARADMREHVDEAVSKVTAELRAEIKALEERQRSRAGRMPIAKVWRPDAAALEGELVVAPDGGLYQARQMTGQPPGGDHWQCLAPKGRDGRDGAQTCPRGEWDERDAYAPLDICTRNGHAYICTRANPGVPGQCDDWMLLASRGPEGPQGKQGRMGPQGQRGEPGADAPQIISWHADPARPMPRAAPVTRSGLESACQCLGSGTSSITASVAADTASSE